MRIRKIPSKVAEMILSFLPGFIVVRLIRHLVLAIERKLAGRTVAILGGEQVGKSTLVQLLDDGTAEEWTAHEGRTATRGVKFSGKDRKKVDLNVLRDLPSDPGLAYAPWKNAFNSADHVWYLFRSDLIAQGDRSEISKVKAHLDMFKDWMNPKKPSRPKIILVGTGADRDLAYKQSPANFSKKVGRVTAIKVGQVKLNHAALIVGSFATKREANRLIRRLRDNL